jgi:hypothetical protein
MRQRGRIKRKSIFIKHKIPNGINFTSGKVQRAIPLVINSIAQKERPNGTKRPCPYLSPLLIGGLNSTHKDLYLSQLGE